MQRISARLATLDSELKDLQYQLTSLLESDEAIESEQTVLDTHDTDIDNLSVRIQRLLTATRPASRESSEKQS